VGKWLVTEPGKELLGGIAKRGFRIRESWRFGAVVLCLLVLLVTCMPDRGGQRGELHYRGPTELSIARGEFLAGTPLQYLGKTEDGTLVSIEGQQALKKTGDSLNWVHNPVDGVAVDLNLRVALITEEKLHVLGTVKASVLDPVPHPAEIEASAPIRYKLPVNYRIKKGQTIPGTDILYLGETEKGAHLANVEGYPYRELGDSIVWRGQLRDRLWLELNLRTAFISKNSLNVAGIAELSITPEEERHAVAKR
jgi:hypothetical protein